MHDGDAQRAGVRQVDDGRQRLAAEDHVDGAAIGPVAARTVRLVRAEHEVARSIAIEVAGRDPDAESVAGARPDDRRDAGRSIGPSDGSKVDAARVDRAPVVDEDAAGVVPIAGRAVVVLGPHDEVRELVAVQIRDERLVAEEIARPRPHDGGDVRRLGGVDDRRRRSRRCRSRCAPLRNSAGRGSGRCPPASGTR